MNDKAEVRFKAALLRSEADARGRSFAFLVLPKAASAGDTVELQIAPASRELESKVPADLGKALNAAPGAKAVWKDITPIARRDWIQWITSAKQAETRARRIRNACDMLGSGKKRVCCFDRSGYYSKGLAAPKAAVQ